MLLTRRATLRLVLFTGIAATSVGLTSAPLAGGGIALFVDIPREDTDSRLKECDFVAQARGCAGTSATFRFTAEGVVNGKRISLVLTPIDATPADGPVNLPTFGFRREWPLEGRWVVCIVADSAYYYPEMKNDKPTGKRLKRQYHQSVIVPILPDGTPEMRSTPGAKYDTFVKFIKTNKANREKTIAQLLIPTGTRVGEAVKR